MKTRPKTSDDIKELLRLVQAGKLFAVQDWIKAGKRLRGGNGGKSESSVLRAAVTTGFHSLVEELLRAGGWSPSDLAHSLELARSCKQYDVAELLGSHGAPAKLSTFRTSCEKLDLFMMERLLRSGIDPNRDNVFAEVLTSIKARPLLRFYRQFRTEFPALDDQAALALSEAVKNRQVRWSALLAWAGADPFRHVPNELSEPFPVDPENYTTAARQAFWCSNPEIMKALHLKPNAAQALEALSEISFSNNYKLFQTLVKCIPRDQINDSPRGSSLALEGLVRRWAHCDLYSNKQDGKGDVESLQCLETLLDLGARWNPPLEELHHIRRTLLKHDARYVVQLLRLLLYTPNTVNLDSFLEICRSQTLAANIAGVDAPLAQEIKELRKGKKSAITSISENMTMDQVQPAASAPGATV